MRKIGSYRSNRKEAGFTKKNGELVITPRAISAFMSLTVKDFQSSALPTELPAHVDEKHGGSRKLRCGTRVLYWKPPNESSPMTLAFFYLPLNKCNHLCLKFHVVECVDFLNASRTGDIHFSEVVANNVEPNKIEPFLP
jgi:hypothetical protein